MQELKQKGISDYCIKSGMKEIDGDQYYQNLVDLLEKKDRQEKERHPGKAPSENPGFSHDQRL